MFYPDTEHFTTVIAPAMGSVVLGSHLAKALGKRFIFTEKDITGNQVLKRFNISKGESFLVFDNVLTTGKSLEQVIAIVESSGGFVSESLVVVNRSKRKSYCRMPIYALFEVESNIWTTEECFICNKRLN